MAVIGAGPVGLAAALGALSRGFEVTVFEKGQVGQALRMWGSTRFFTPVRMNISASMRRILGDMPGDDELLTASEFIDRVLRPVATSEPLRARIRTETPVLAIGRRGLTRTDYVGHPLRSERPFRLIVKPSNAGRGSTDDGERAPEEVFECDIVLDATGGYVVPNAIGTGGLPAIGESTLTPPPIRTLAALEAMRDRLPGKRVLLVGDGHSAANAMVILAAIEDVRVTWLVRTPNHKPVEEVFGDPLSERQRVVSTANELAEDPPLFLSMERRATVERFDKVDGEIRATLTGGRTVLCDLVVAFTGFHPSNEMSNELPVEISPVTQGTARLHRAIANVTDCLSVPRVGPEDLATGESGFYFIGARAYGRAGSFLLQTGLAQVETILDSLR